MLNKRFTTLFTLLLIYFGCLLNTASAFTCRDVKGNTLDSTKSRTGSLDVYVDLTPKLLPGEVLVVNIGGVISCKNDRAEDLDDYVGVLEASNYNGALKDFSGTLKYYNKNYTLPMTKNSKMIRITSGVFVPWDVQLSLTPVSIASGVLIKKNSKIATLFMKQLGSNKSAQPAFEARGTRFTWNIYSNNDVYIPTGGCDVSSRNLSVTLPDYPGTVAIPLTVHCAKKIKLAYYLTGATTDTNKTIFKNVASEKSAAKGIGVQLSNSKGVIATNKNISLGEVGSESLGLGLTASYARTTGKISVGDVESVIGVTFVNE